MDFGLGGKRALVGGASQGLGLACAQALAAEGCRVALVARSPDHLEEALATLPRGVAAVGIAADLSQQAAREHCYHEAARFGEPDVLVLNSGGPPPGGPFAHGDDVWQQAYESLLLYVKATCERFVPAMQQRGWGRVIAITSRTVKEPAGNLVLSNVFRSGVTAYLKGLSREVAANGVTVNTVLPGAFRTSRYEQLLDAMADQRGVDKELVAKETIAQLPQGRFQEPAELGALVAFLASVQASAITGAAIPVDGGALSGLLG